jgi:HK97 family phage portal protein
MGNFIKSAFDRLVVTGKEIIHHIPENLKGMNLMPSFFSWSLGRMNAFDKYAKSYGENPLVYMVVKKIASTSASIDRTYFNSQGEAIDNSRLEEIMSNPNEESDEILFKEKINEQLLLTGNTFIRKIQGEGGMGVELEVLYTQNMDVLLNSLGEVAKYFYTYPNGSTETIEKEEVLHIKMSNVINIHDKHYYFGLSPLQSAWIVISSSTEKFKAEASIFKNRGIIGMLTSDADTPMLEPERKRLQDEFDNEVGGSEKFNKIKISNSKLRFIQTGMSPTDLRLIEGIMNSLRLIASAYGMPSVLFNDTENSTYNNYETANKVAYTDVYLPLAKKIDKELSKFLQETLGVDEYFCPDITSIEVLKSSTNETSMAINSAPKETQRRIVEVMTKNEVRSLIDLGEIQGGEELMGSGSNTKTNESNNQTETN